jgi:hypothetical protein
MGWKGLEFTMQVAHPEKVFWEKNFGENCFQNPEVPELAKGTNEMAEHSERHERQGADGQVIVQAPLIMGLQNFRCRKAGACFHLPASHFK